MWKTVVLAIVFTFPLGMVSANNTPISIQSIVQDTQYSPPAPTSKSYTFHNPIVINSNSDFTYANGVIGGSGDWNDPYVISNWDFSTNTNQTQIFINATDKHFIISDCIVHGHDLLPQSLGIYFLDVRNGTVKNCIVSGNYQRGIFLISNYRESYNNTRVKS